MLTLAYILALFHMWISISDSLKVFYSDSKFERKPVSQKQFDEILINPLTQFVPVSNGDNFYVEATLKPIYLNVEDLDVKDESQKDEKLFVYLGSKAGVEFVAVDIISEKKLKSSDKTSETIQSEPIPSKLPLRLQTSGIKSDMLRSFSEQLVDHDDASLLAHARGMIVWHTNTQYCCKCGSKTKPQRAGASRKCINENCKSSSYPRLEPASIMLITDRTGDYCLLGRKSIWPVGRYSALAGFTEVGETLEQTVIRETYEEAGVRVDADSLRMVISQPWPFPSSLMIGYRGICEGEGLPVVNFDAKEMQDVKWFSKNDVRNGLEGGSTSLGDWKPNEKESILHFPGISSLARVLITQWCNEK